MIWLSLVFLSMFVFQGLTVLFEGTDRWNNLPEHINTPKKWEGKDDSKHWYTDWLRYYKDWFAYDWKKPHWFGSLRRYPVTLFAVFGEGDVRWENDFMALRSTNNTVIWYFPAKNGFYLSRIQYYCQWHINIQWPLGIFFHIKYGKKGLIYGYLGWKRDTDVWWFPNVFLGGTWK